MTTAEAIYRAIANIWGEYEEHAHLDDDEYKEKVASIPCPLPDDDGYPFGSDLIEAHAFLDMPYKWFLRLDDETRLGYLDGIADHLAYETPGDVLDALLSWIIDTDTPKGKIKKSGDGFKRSGREWNSPMRQAYDWAEREPRLTHRDVSVLFAMVGHSDNQGQEIFVSQPRVAERLRYNRTTISRAMAALRELGVLTCTKEATQHYTATWKLNPPPEVKE